MKEQLISFETAKLAKEKGFSYKVGYFFYKDGSKGYMNDIGESVPNCEADWNNTYEEIHKDKCSAPTQSLLQKWLRDDYTVDVTAIPIKLRNNPNIYYQFRIVDFRTILIEDEVMYEHQYNVSSKEYPSYEEALEKGLQEALKLIE